MPEPLLETRALVAGYGDFRALHGIDLAVDEGETLAVIGANGAGKTTLLRAIMGAVRVARDQVWLAGEPIGGEAPERVVRRGIAMVPEGRKLFPSLSVRENLLLGGYAGRAGPWSLAGVEALFPILRERARQPATSLSGGQQQMVAIGRALMANPRVLLCDEISLGLAPIIIRDIYRALPDIVGQGTTVLIVEQDVNQALAAAARVVCLRQGQVSLRGRPAELSRDAIADAYFGRVAA